MHDELDVPINEKKSVKSSICGEMQGGVIDGAEGTLCPKMDKVARYVRGAWNLLQSKRADLKRSQMVASGLVYSFSYRSCLMSCLNEVWSFISSFNGRMREWKIIPDAVKMELFSSLALTPLAYLDMRCPYDPIVTASDASESGGGLSLSDGLTKFGIEASTKDIRGLALRRNLSDDSQILVVSLFDGIGACRVALDTLNAHVGGYVAVAANLEARQVLENSFSSAEVVDFVESVTEDLVKAWGCKYSRVGLVLISGGPPCQRVSGLTAGRLGSERDPLSSLHHEIPRVKRLIEAQFIWATVFTLMESVSSMSIEDRSCMSRSMGILPYEVDASD